MKSFVRPALSGILALSLVSLNGCIAGLTYTVPGVSGGAAATSIYGIDETNDHIDKYSLSTSGSVTASVVLSPPSGGSNISSVATDSTGQVYMGYSATGNHESIAVFPAGATTSTAPTRTFATGYSFFGQGPDSMFVDAQGLVYATVNSSTVAVYAANATGTATPLRAITGLTNIYDVTADSSGNIYVVTYSSPTSIQVFSSTATGSVTPTRTITAPTGYSFFGVAVDASGDVFASETSRSTNIGSIVEFAPGTSGTVTPTKTFGASQPANISGLRMDAAGNVYVEATLTGAPGTTSFVGFPPTASGVTTPIVAIISSTISNNDYNEIAVF